MDEGEDDVKWHLFIKQMWMAIVIDLIELHPTIEIELRDHNHVSCV